VRALALNGLGRLTYMHDHRRVDEAAALIVESLELWRALGDRSATMVALYGLGDMALGQGHYDRARHLFEQALAIARQLAQPTWQAIMHFELGLAAYGQGDGARAAALVQTAQTLHRGQADPWGTAITLNALGLIDCDRADFTAAAARFAESLPLLRRVGNKEGLADWLARVATLAATGGRMEAAARLFGAAHRQLEEVGYTFELPQGARFERAVEAARRSLGAAGFAAADGAGRSLGLEAAVAEAAALLACPTEPSLAPPDIGLTPRERDVLRLLAAGRSDGDIAAALSISRRTVTTHVTNLLAKLGVDSRAAAASLALRHRYV
jgi:non-specific serine/threonine protein kinase